MDRSLLREDLKSKYEQADSRQHIYNFLSRVYFSEPTLQLYKASKGISFISPYSDSETNLFAGLEEFDETKLITELEVEYTRLFIGPNGHISPHESIQRGEDRHWGDYTVEVNKFYEQNGFATVDDYRGMPDHISVELLFLSNLVEEEKNTINQNDIDSFHQIIQKEYDFIKQHPLIWINEFADKVCESAEYEFYKILSKFCSDFLVDEFHYLENTLAELNSSRG